jgi:hypothetical protein
MPAAAAAADTAPVDRLSVLSEPEENAKQIYLTPRFKLSKLTKIITI